MWRRTTDKSLTMEIFKTIPAFPDYEISNYGRLKTKKRLIRYVHARTREEQFRKGTSRFLKEHINGRTGYKFYQLYLNKKMYNRTVHRLVAETFLPREEGRDYVNHKDGNKHNNTVDNLEWCTNEYNHEHATATGLKPKGERIGSSKLTEQSVRAIKRLLSQGFTREKIAALFDVNHTSITHISTGKTWKHIDSH